MSEHLACDHCGDSIGDDVATPCPHWRLLCGTCDARGECHHCEDQRAADAHDDAAVDAAIEERAS